ncbi:Acetolactate synthase isozyme 3 large subunit [Pigmentiphaga humi]|uniref:Acetolactate synthase isozyme 3 large subunit n=1 Tax=Pigmentiphaga humi TaxID=2478468 RepID=A0A3P4B4A2_9BURK|nr:thiamine pyrophosphate-requiring protein [Pigmentiphaga humi]VCU70872.1 Acetolactate synthase isozyme 3 large subunit [Pigmentiphaga humi]
MKHDQGSGPQTTASHFLDGLLEVGIDYLFCNMGTDHAPIIEELAARRRLGVKSPTVIRCPHESTAAHMAGGYALVTGRGQGVLVHVDVGTANASMAMHNLLRSRIPVLLMAGKAPFTSAGELLGSRDTYVHFVQEPFDQGSLVRPYVKWEWTLPSGAVVKETLRRAHAVMHSAPQGPAYLMLPRETLTERWEPAQVRAYGVNQFGPARESGADPEVVARIADRLEQAEHPILVTAYAGRCSGASEAIEALAAYAGIRVFEPNMVNNISHEGPNFCGAAPDRHLARADVAFMVDVDVPWFPRDVAFNPDTHWVQIDVDVLKQDSPMWSFPANERVQARSARVLEQVLRELQRRADGGLARRAQARNAAIAQEREARIRAARSKAEMPGEIGQINTHYLFAQLARHLDDRDIIMNEAVRNAGIMAMHIPRPIPGTMVRVGGGGLGASGGMALGAKLAAPDAMVVQVVGDGSFYFNNPNSVFAVSRQQKLPILTVVLDNGGWSAVKQSTLRVYPDGDAQGQDWFEAELPEGVEYAKIAEAFGALGETVADPAALPEAIQRCVAAVRNGRSALLHVAITRI